MPYPSDTIPNNNDGFVATAKKLLRIFNDAVNGNSPIKVSSSGSESSIPDFRLLGDSEQVIIPSGAVSWSYTVLIGTALVGRDGQTGIVVTVGLSDSSEKKLSQGISVTAGAASSVYVRWNT